LPFAVQELQPHRQEISSVLRRPRLANIAVGQDPPESLGLLEVNGLLAVLDEEGEGVVVDGLVLLEGAVVGDELVVDVLADLVGRVAAGVDERA
jgi:hypothetical protein